MNVAVFTDESNMADFLGFLFKDVAFAVYDRQELNTPASDSRAFTHIIVGVPRIEPEDWKRLRNACRSGAETYLMIRERMTPFEMLQAKGLGIADILMDPNYRLARDSLFTPAETLVQISLTHTGKPAGSSEPLVCLGKGAYFHKKQLWVKYGDTKEELTEKQAALLNFFLDHEGEVLTKHKLAEHLWGGYINPEGIPKVVARLKSKIGPAASLISSRQLGGFLYLREQEHLG